MLDNAAIEAELDEIMREHLELSCQKGFMDLGLLVPILEDGSLRAPIQTNAESNMTFIVVRCAVGPVARTVCELWLVQILLSSSDAGSMTGTAMTTIIPKN